MTLPSNRLLNLAGFLVCAGLMGFALFAEYVLLLDPCPLCVFQRVAVILLGIVFLVAALHDPRGKARYVYGVLLGLIALGGIGVAGWHVRMQNLPPEEVPTCGPGLSYILENNAFGDALAIVFTGSGSCADVVWEFLGLSMPWWVLLWLLALGTAGVFVNFRRPAPAAAP
ncbi:MAG: disulfide bond formation protein B [Woeseiaceae bacterium]|jgi:disulfide bond formation protein DsbB|nr:disulfide bond formation protein B [Woeseiaceae bacterium]